jgi:hypothetical protein
MNEQRKLRDGYQNKLHDFWARVKVRDTGCWEWIGDLHSNGYGRFPYRGTYCRAHRFAWRICEGPIPPGLLICHHCDNKICVNPDHLFLGTNRDNALDAMMKGRLPSGNRNGHFLHPELTPRGEDVYCAKLTDAKVREVLLTPGPARIFAERFGVTLTAIQMARKGRTWKHIYDKVKGIVHVA